MSIDLWAARLDRPLTEAEAAALTDQLPSPRRQRLQRTRRVEDRREPLCAYALLRLALEARHSWKGLPEVAVSALGKPYFPEYPAAQFSLSHTRGAVLIGLWDRPLGVDIERVRPLCPQRMKRITGAVTEEAFFRDWVRREARAKRTEQGIGAFLRGEPPTEEGEQYWAVETFPGYAAGLSAGDGASLPSVRLMDLEELLKGVL